VSLKSPLVLGVLVMFMLAIQIVSQVALPAYAQPLQVRRRVDKGLIVDASYVVDGRSGAPSFSDLKAAGFNLIGTIAYSSWTPNWEWKKTQQWVQAAHAAGFKVMINVLANNGSKVAGMTQLAANIGADIVALDEVISLFPSYMTEARLQSIIEMGRAANPNLEYFINDWSNANIAKAYQWTTSYPYVRVAEDDYNVKSTIDWNIQLGKQYGKAPAAWLIFAKGSMNFDCYNNLDQWLTYAHQRNISTLFWLIDEAGTWNTLWPKVVSYTP